MSFSPRRAAAGRTVVVLALAAAGCGPAATTTVTGTVTYRGAAVPGGSVVLYCADKQIVRGVIGAGGRFAIPNVPPGSVVVTVQTRSRVPAGLSLRQNLPPTINGPIAPTAERPEDERVVPFPPRYALPEESGLTAVVGRDGLTYDIDLQP